MHRRFHLADGRVLAHCSSPPMQAAFRLPQLSWDVEAVTRPRAPLRPAKWEEASETEEVVEFDMNRPDGVEVKVEAEEVAEAPAEWEGQRVICAQLSTVSIAPPAPDEVRRRGPGRPKGSASKPRVEPRFDRSAPPDRDHAKKARARIANVSGRR